MNEETNVYTMGKHKRDGSGIEYILTIAGNPGRCPQCGMHLEPEKGRKQWGWLCFKNCGYYRKISKKELVSVEERTILARKDRPQV